VRERHPDLAILHTFFSPSGYEYARKLGESEHIEYLPEDTPGRLARLLEALRPRVLVFVKFDLWPNLIVQAHARDVPVLLVDATLRPGSWRSRWPARRLYRQLYARLHCISAVSANDAARFAALVPAHPRIVVDGDTRFDQVRRRRRDAHRVPIAPALRDAPRFRFIAGSTWPPDEERVVPAWAALRRDWTAATPPLLVVVPHEPTPAHLQPLHQRIAAAGLKSLLYSDLESERAGAADLAAADVLVVDRVGILAELYACADAAYVGGAFTTGVHNVMEPATHGLPIGFGPRHRNAPEAERLLEASAAVVIRSAADLEAALRSIAGDRERLRRMGQAAKAYVEANLGASERCFDRLAAVLGPPAAISGSQARPSGAARPEESA
jgi:3-deoxy-D-manno-octulosonic-acid transferase